MRKQKFIQITVLILLGVGLTACLNNVGKVPVDDKARQALVDRECALYFAVTKEMAARGLPEVQSLVSGCKSTDLVVDIKPMEPPPQITSRFGTQVYDRMKARGMPTDIADEVRKSRAFVDVVSRSDAFYGS